MIPSPRPQLAGVWGRKLLITCVATNGIDSSETRDGKSLVKRWIRASTTNRIALLQRDEIVHDNSYNINESSTRKNNPFCMRIIRSNDGLAKIADDDDDTREGRKVGTMR